MSKKWKRILLPLPLISRFSSFPAIFFKGQSSLYYSFPVTDIESNTVRYRRGWGAPGRGGGGCGWPQGKGHRAMQRIFTRHPVPSPHIIQPQSSALRRNIIADQVAQFSPSSNTSSNTSSHTNPAPNLRPQAQYHRRSGCADPTLIQPSRLCSSYPHPTLILPQSYPHPTPRVIQAPPPIPGTI